MSDVLAGLTIGVTATMLAKLYCKRLTFEEVRYEEDVVVLVEENVKTSTTLHNEAAV